MIHGHIFLSEDNSEVYSFCYLARAKCSNTGIVPQQQNAIWGRCTNVVITLALKKQNKTNKQIEEKMFNNSITKRNEIITKKHYKPVRLQTNDSLLSFRLFAEWEHWEVLWGLSVERGLWLV